MRSLHSVITVMFRTSTYLPFPFSAKVGFREADFTIAAWIDLCTPSVSCTIPRYAIATKLVVLPILSCRAIITVVAVIVTVVSKPVVILRFSKDNTEDSQKKESLEQRSVRGEENTKLG